MRDKERERQKLKSRRESEDTKADAKESREKDRERFYEETKKKLAHLRFASLSIYISVSEPEPGAATFLVEPDPYFSLKTAQAPD